MGLPVQPPSIGRPSYKTPKLDAIRGAFTSTFSMKCSSIHVPKKLGNQVIHQHAWVRLQMGEHPVSQSTSPCTIKSSAKSWPLVLGNVYGPPDLGLPYSTDTLRIEQLWLWIFTGTQQS